MAWIKSWSTSGICTWDGLTRRLLFFFVFSIVYLAFTGCSLLSKHFHYRFNLMVLNSFVKIANYEFLRSYKAKLAIIALFTFVSFGSRDAKIEVRVYT